MIDVITNQPIIEAQEKRARSLEEPNDSEGWFYRDMRKESKSSKKKYNIDQIE